MAKDKKAVVEIPEDVIVSREEVVAEIGEEAVAKIEEEAELQDEEVVIVPSEETKGDSVTVTWRGNSRTYSKAVHGKEFRALAKEFAAKFDGQLS